MSHLERWAPSKQSWHSPQQSPRLSPSPHPRSASHRVPQHSPQRSLSPHPPQGPPQHTPAPRRKVTYREVVAAEVELQELERQHEEMLELQRGLPLMRSRLEAMQKGTTKREEAMVRLIQEREDELIRVQDEIQYIESMQADTSARVWPALLTSEPLGDSLKLAIKDIKDILSSKKQVDVLNMKRPAVWPSPLILADLWISSGELHALHSFLGASSTPMTCEGLGLDLNSNSSGMLHKALDMAEELAERFAHQTLFEKKREHEDIQADLDVTIRSYELRLRAVLEAQGPLHRALCIQELKRCQLLLLLHRRLVTLSEEEANWYMEFKARMMNKKQGDKARSVISETYKLRNFLRKACDLESSDDVAKQDGKKQHAMHSRSLFQAVTGRREVEVLRQKVSAGEMAVNRSASHPKLAALETETRAILEEVKQQVKETHKLLENFATWASKTEAALTLFGLTKPSWCAIAALAPETMSSDVKRLRQAMTKILKVTTKDGDKKVGPSSSPKPRLKVGAKKRTKSLEVTSTITKIKEVKRRSTV